MICFTSLTLGYLPRARVLAETLRAAHPGWPLWAVLVDRPPEGFPPDALAAFDGVVQAEELYIPRVRAWLFKHDLVEACTAVKGAMLLRLLHGHGAEGVIYLDPDIALFHPLRTLPDLLARHSVLLTPHQIAPSADEAAFADNELTALRCGVFNLGFLAVRNDAAGRGFATWWAERLHVACYDDPAAGLFTDQRYADLAPALFDGVGIVRDPGWNVATWNLGRRRLRITPEGDITANGAPLCFYHFSKHGGVGDVMLDRYAGAAHEPHELWRWYGRQLAAQAEPAVPEGWWHYGRFSDGTPIPHAARLLYRKRPDLIEAFEDPFDARPGSFRAWLAREMPAMLD